MRSLVIFSSEPEMTVFEAPTEAAIIPATIRATIVNSRIVLAVLLWFFSFLNEF
jgi:hypothetical protein